MKIELIKTIDKAELPEFHSEGAAAVDLHVYVDNQKGREMLPNGQVKKFRTGIKVHIKDPGYVGIIVPRSGTATKRGIVLANTAGVIDSDYQGEIMLALRNQGGISTMIEDGERVAQMLFIPVARPEFSVVEEFDKATERGEGGFGSTGTKKKAVKKKAAA